MVWGGRGRIGNTIHYWFYGVWAGHMTIDPSALTPGDGFNNSILAGLGTLIRTMIQSPNYVPGVSGWTINKDGSAEFNNLTIRGTFDGTDFIINVNGAFFYNGAPGSTTLSIGIAPVATTDPFGTSVNAGVWLYNSSLPLIGLNPGSTSLDITEPGIIRYLSGATFEQSPAQIIASVGGTSPAQFIAMAIEGASTTTVGAHDKVVTQFNSAAADNSSSANESFDYIGSNGTEHEYAFLDITGFNILAGAITAVHPGSSPAVGESWQSVALTNSWTGGPLNFKKMPDNTVYLMCAPTTPAAAVNGTIATLPVGYRPANPQPFNGTHALAASFNEHFTINTNGTLVASGFGASQPVYIDDFFPLDL
jgi:hypothetical protein